MSAPRSVAVLGAGNWGTTLAHLIAENGHAVRLWSRDPLQVREIEVTRRNAKAVPGLELSARIQADADLGRAVSGASVVVVVVPAQAMREVARQLGDVLDPEQVVVHGSKGLELQSHLRMSEVLAQETCAKKIGVIAGPNIAAEVAAGLPAGTVVTSRFPDVVRRTKQLLSSPRMMVFAASDMVGVELCGALKNVVAIAAGMASAMAVGENALALLITRGLAEIAALATAFGAHPGTLAGLAGVGDLMVTCRSRHSRNHRIGEALAHGASLEDAVRSLGMVAEGVSTSVAATELAKQRAIQVPLLEHVYRVIHDGLPPRDALEALLRLRTGRDVPWAG